MRVVVVVAAGATFVGCVVGGFALGVAVAQRTGASWWAIAGVFAGLLAGTAGVVTQLRQALRSAG
jgi:hypothetical protein